MHGYHVSPRRFCWFIDDDEEMLSHIKKNYAFFFGPILSIYKASQLAFPEEHELEKAVVFSHQILQMGIMNMRSQNDSISATSTKFEQEGGFVGSLSRRLKPPRAALQLRRAMSFLMDKSSQLVQSDSDVLKCFSSHRSLEWRLLVSMRPSLPQGRAHR